MAGRRPGSGRPEPDRHRTGLGRHAARLGSWPRMPATSDMGTCDRRARSRTFDVWHAHDFTGLVAASMARPRGHRARLRHARPVPRHRRGHSSAGTGALAARAGTSVASRGTPISSSPSTRAWRPTPASTTPLLGRSRSSTTACRRGPTPDPRPTLIRDASGSLRAEPVVLYHGLLGADRGLDTLLRGDARARPRACPPGAPGLRPRSRSALRSRRRARNSRTDPCPRCCLSRGPPALGGVRRRRRDAEPAAHAERAPVDSEQAVRVDRGRPAGGLVGLPGAPPDHPATTRLGRWEPCATRRIRRRSPAPSARSSTSTPSLATTSGDAAARRRACAGTGSQRRGRCSRAIARAAGRRRTVGDQ